MCNLIIRAILNVLILTAFRPVSKNEVRAVLTMTVVDEQLSNRQQRVNRLLLRPYK